MGRHRQTWQVMVLVALGVWALSCFVSGTRHRAEAASPAELNSGVVALLGGARNETLFVVDTQNRMVLVYEYDDRALNVQDAREYHIDVQEAHARLSRRARK